MQRTDQTHHLERDKMGPHNDFSGGTSGALVEEDAPGSYVYEMAMRSSELTPEEAWRLSEESKQEWWESRGRPLMERAMK